jgi:NDP-sugar pyrophosphorylase family protein
MPRAEQTFVAVDDVRNAFIDIVHALLPHSGRPADPAPGIDAEAVIGEDAAISPLACIGRRVRIGAGTRVGPGAVLYADTEIGRDCVIGPGAIIGWVSPTTTEAIGSAACLRILPARGSATASTWAHAPASVAACSQI